MFRRLICGIGIVFIVGLNASALDIVYPKKENVIINSPSTFFVGSADYSKNLTINGRSVKVHPSGGFASSVPLNFGVNTFTLKSGDRHLVYKIIRPEEVNAAKNKSELIQFKVDKNLKVVRDLAPLRSTPIDDGVNRLAHLKKDIPLVSDGECNNFYRIKLGSAAYGWILKSNVADYENNVEKVKILGADIDSDGEFYHYTFHLTGTVPWTVEETPDLIKITLYNISNFSNNLYKIILPLKELMNGKKLIGYSVDFLGNDFIVNIRKPLQPEGEYPLKGLKIAIDAGHGGNEVGAVGCLGDFEKDINLLYAKDLVEILKAKGADAFLIREKDENVSLEQRVSKANNENSTVFISLHGNALPDSGNPENTRGAEIYYYYPQSKGIADSIMEAMSVQAGIINHGIFQRSFAVIRNTKSLSILIELGYLINPEDNALLLDKNFRKKSVNAIADGLEKYFSTQR